MSLRQLTRRLGRGSLQGFWQGRYTLQPWNEVANSHAPPPDSQAQGHGWDTSGDHGFATFSNVTNPSIGLDSIYQKHVYSRLAPLEAPEGAGDSSDGKGEAVVAAAVFATLQPAAAAAAQKCDDASSVQQRAEETASRLEHDLTADSVAVVIEGALDKSLTEEPAASAGARFGPVTDPHIERNALEIAAAATARAAAHHQDLPEPAKPPAAPQQVQPGPAARNTVSSPESSQTQPSSGGKASAAPAAEQGEKTQRGQASTAAVKAQPTAAVQEPDLALGLLWALPEEARETTLAPAKTGTWRSSAASAGGNACMDKEALLARSLAEVARRNARQTGSRPAAAAKQEEVTESAPGARHKEAASKSAAAAPERVSTGPQSRPALAQPAAQLQPPVAKLSAGAAATEASVPRSQGASAPAFVRPRRPASLNPRDSAAERDAEGQQSIAVDDKFLWQSRWRLDQLLDKGSVKALHDSAEKGVLAVQGSVCGRPVYAYCLDAAAMGDVSAEQVCRQISRLMDSAVTSGHPVVAIHSGSASSGPTHWPQSQQWADLLLRQMDASGVIPQLSVELTPPTSSDALALLKSTADFVFTVGKEQQTASHVSFPAAPSATAGAASMRVEQLVTDKSRKASGQMMSQRRLSASAALAASGLGRLAAFLHAFVHQSLGLIAAMVAALQRAVQPVQATCEQGPAPSGCGGETCAGLAPAHQVANEQLVGVCGSEREALHRVRELLMYLPASNACPAPTVDCLDSERRVCQALDAAAAGLLNGVPVPADLLVRSIVDGGNACSFVPGGPGSPAALAFARLGSHAVGILAFPFPHQSLNHSPHSGLPIRAARLVRFCDAFNLPVVALLLPSFSSPAQGSQNRCSSATPEGSRSLANLIFAFSEATVPKLTIVVGGGEAALLSQCLRSDVTLAWASRGVPSTAGGAARIIDPCSTRAALCAELAPLLQPRIVARPRRKHALLPL